MPEFMDVHRGMVDITPEALREAHQADLDIQGDEASTSSTPGRTRSLAWCSACRKRPAPRPYSASMSALVIPPMRSTRFRSRRSSVRPHRRLVPCH
jgi:hypothetical protein